MDQIYPKNIPIRNKGNDEEIYFPLEESEPPHFKVISKFVRGYWQINFWIYKMNAGANFQLLFNYKSKKSSYNFNLYCVQLYFKNISLLFELSNTNISQNST